MGGRSAIARAVLHAASIVALPSCGLEHDGTGAMPAAPDDARPTANLDASVARAPVRDAGLEASVTDASAAEPVDAATPCSFTGTFAMKLEFDVAWEGTAINLGLGDRTLIAPGAGTLVVYNAATVRAQGGELVATLAPCGAEVPDFRNDSARAPEVYGGYVSDLAWESGAMPRWLVTWQPACAEPGCAILSSPFEGWIGASRAPVDAPRAQVHPLDADGDGNDGITLLMRHGDEQNAQGEPYTQPPIGLAPVSRLRTQSRAHDLRLAFAMRAQFEGRVQSCDHFEGAGGAAYARAVTFGCTTQEGSSLSTCSASLSRAVEAFLPHWQVRAARYRTERIADDRCESVRAKLRGR